MGRSKDGVQAVMSSGRSVRDAAWREAGLPWRRAIRACAAPARAEPLEGRMLLSAYAYSELPAFGSNTTGTLPFGGLTADAAGNLYGTGQYGGAFGAGNVFEIAKGSSAITTLASFNGGDGAEPMGQLTVDGQGDVYGTTFRGGAGNHGSVFEVAKGAGAITTLASFASGLEPQSTVAVDASGNVFGTTRYGGTGNEGIAYEIASGSNTVTTLVNFSSTGNGTFAGLLLDSAGNLYGTTAWEGVPQVGTVFEIPAGSTSPVTIASFNSSNGAYPEGDLTMDASGNIFGNTHSGGANGLGTVFEIAAGSNAITTIASFDSNSGSGPTTGPKFDASGNLYGTTVFGGASNAGTIWELPAGSTTITPLVSLTAQTTLAGGVVPDSSGNLYGQTQYGGAYQNGTVFKLANGSSSIQTLTSFDGINGTHPNAGVTLDSSGSVYTTATYGGAYNDGSILEVPQGSGTITTLASFNGADGSAPKSALTFDASGDLYGTTTAGGPNSRGVVFEVPAGSNTITDLASLPAVGGQGVDQTCVVIDAAGNLFVASSYGGALSDGAIYEIASGSNTLTTLASFDGTNGKTPNALVLDSSGNLYGTALTGGVNGVGTVFEVASGSSAITTMASLPAAGGGSPDALTFDAQGNLYVAGRGGGANSYGSIFEIPSGSNQLTTRASFTAAPISVAVDAAGNVFGSANAGYDVFEIPKGSNTATQLASILRPNEITRDPFGNLYGTTWAGGPTTYGSMFKLTANTQILLRPAGSSSASDGSAPLTFTATLSGGAPDGQSVYLEDASNKDAVVATGILGGGSASLTVPAGILSSGAHHLIAVYAGDGTYAASESATYDQTITLPSLPAYITASSNAAYTYNASTGALSLTTGTLTFTADNTAAPAVNLAASGPASGVFFDTSEHLAGLTLSGGAQATVLSLGSARTHSNHNVLVIGTTGSINDPTFSIDASSKLDLTDNDLIVHAGSSDQPNGGGQTTQLGTLQGLAAIGRNVAAGGVLDGTWTGNGLTSSSAASVDAAAGYEQNVLAVVQNSDQVLGKDSAWTVGNFSEPLGSNDIIVKYTYNGDAALEGYVGDDSVTIVNGLYNSSPATWNDWAFGEFTGSATVDDNDITILNGLYGNGTAASGLPEL